MTEHIVLDHEDPKARNTAEHPNSVAPRREDGAGLHDGRLTALLPRLSWNVLRLSEPT
jgi:alpha-N-arabinofuranosidase